MNSDWQTVQLGDCVELVTGFPFKSNGYTDDPDAVRLLRGDNIGQGQLRWEGVKKWPVASLSHLEDYSLRESDVVLAMDRPWIPAGLKFARIRKADLPAFLVQRVARLRPNSRLTGDFLYCVIASPEFTQYIQNIQTGTAVPHISGKQIKEYRFVLPDLPTQIRCGELLATLDERIATIRETNGTLDSIGQTLFKSWFVDFDPVRAKQEGRAPEGMDEETAALFPDRFDESPLGKIPKGWSVGTILDVARLLSGGTPKTDRTEYWGGDIPWASAKDVSQSTDSILINTERTITQCGLDESSTRMIPAFASVVVARGATTGRMVLFGNSMAMNQTCYALASLTDTPIALYCLLRREIGSLVNAAHGSVFDTITTSTFAQSAVIRPPEALLRAFEDVASPLFQKMLVATREMHSIRALRDTLLPRLVSGQLRLPEAMELTSNVMTGT